MALRFAENTPATETRRIAPAKLTKKQSNACVVQRYSASIPMSAENTVPIPALRIWPIWLMLIAILATLAETIADETSTGARLQVEALPAWRRWADRMEHCSAQIIYKRKSWDSSVGEVIRTYAVEYFADGPASMRVDVRNAESANILAEVMNPRYGFSVGKKPEQNTYELRRFGGPLGHDGSEVSREKMTQLYEDYAEPILTAAFCVKTIPMQRILEAPHFVVKKATEQTLVKKRVYELEFEYRDSNPRYAPFEWARVTFDLEHDWCVTGYEQLGRRSRHIGRIEYSEVNGVFLPKKHSLWILKRDQTEVSDVPSMQHELVKIDFAPIPPTRFLVSEYGLNEPDVASKNRGGLSIWAIIAMLMFFGAICLAISRKLSKATR
jgi:hypothetical protein